MSVKIDHTYTPEQYKQAAEKLADYKKTEDEYSILSTRRLDIKDLKRGNIVIGKSTIPKELGKPTKMATIYEMLRFWGFFDRVRHEQIMERHSITT